MEIHLGTTGLNETFQEPFPATKECPKCHGEARIMFVAAEDHNTEEYVCDLHRNEGKGKYWLHDACCVAVYLCGKCFEVTGLINQG